MSTLVAVLDADVLVPILSCELLLSAFDEDLYLPVITRRSSTRPNATWSTGFTRLDPIALRGRVAQVAAALSHHTHDEGDVTAAAVATVNRQDRHVAATALAHGADLVVSNDRRRVRAAAPGRPPDGIDAAVDALVAKRTRRRVTRSELIDQLAGNFPGFAAELRLRAH